mmetsp:Transcript_33365/g.38662  ORF Transcript_33365/g.38662 Transcript_33365/m.38662 type:complete len:359 (+) Transcript_33365:42-1118(+)
MSSNIIDEVKEYYGKTLTVTEDLATNACCTSAAPPIHIRKCIKNIHRDVISKYYGCGLCVPDAIEGLTVLDLGCGAGRDVYIAAQLVGKGGRVIGVDMTEEQIEVAKRTQDHHAEVFGYANTEFYLGQIENLSAIPELKPNSVDIIISNCVINLCPDKDAVLSDCFKLLKEGGELYFSDVYSSCRVPKILRDDKVLWGECISGALYWNDFINMAKRHGFLDPRLVEDSVITVENPVLEEKIATYCTSLKFFSATYRLFKISSLESHCEDYGQAVIYKGTIPRCEGEFTLDNHHVIQRGKVFPVCGNTWKMLFDTRFEKHFDFVGNFDIHYGIYDGCGILIPFDSARSITNSSEGGSCC